MIKDKLESLNIAMDFFDALNVKGIRYCHWKSNQHLQEALTGLTDIDLLVDKSSKCECRIILTELKFLKIRSQIWARYSDVEDWLGFDYSTGRLIHIHLHYKLVIGDKYVKAYHLPVENVYLDNCVHVNGLMVPQPEYELYMLITRAIIKTENRSIVKAIVRDKINLPASIKKELDWLLARIKKSEMIKVAEELDIISTEILLSFIDYYQADRLSGFKVLSMRSKVKAQLREYRFISHPSYFWRKLLKYLNSKLKIKELLLQKKTIDTGTGYSFALVGADGSGKTTLAKELFDWLNWKMEVRHYYYGIPKKRLQLIIFNKLASLNNCFIRLSKKLGFTFLISFFKKIVYLVECFKWIFIARYRLRICRRSRKYSSRGCVSIAERYPMKEFWSMPEPMDGPRIIGTNSFLGKIERSYYENIKHPDSIFLLLVSLTVAKERKNYSKLIRLEDKVKAVSTLGKSGCYNSVDAGSAYEEVLLNLKRLIWANILDTNNISHRYKI